MADVKHAVKTVSIYVHLVLQTWKCVKDKADFNVG